MRRRVSRVGLDVTRCLNKIGGLRPVSEESISRRKESITPGIMLVICGKTSHRAARWGVEGLGWVGGWGGGVVFRNHASR